MKISKVTITGADNNTHPADMQKLSDKYPFVEWGILFSKSSAGKDRYPSREKIEQFEHLNVNLSAHFCGEYSRNVVLKGDIAEISHHFRFKRVQLNFNFQNTVPELPLLRRVMYTYPNREFILQYNQSNVPAINSFLNTPPRNVALLYDASGGRGTEIRTFSPSFAQPTGYAGGITPDNVESICQTLSKMSNPGESPIWIDMESGVRTDNELDMDKVKKVLEITKNYV